MWPSREISKVRTEPGRNFSPEPGKGVEKKIDSGFGGKKNRFSGWQKYRYADEKEQPGENTPIGVQARGVKGLWDEKNSAKSREGEKEGKSLDSPSW